MKKFTIGVIGNGFVGEIHKMNIFTARMNVIFIFCDRTIRMVRTSGAYAAHIIFHRAHIMMY